MEKSKKFILPTPNFGKKEEQKPQLHYLTPSGMTLLPRERQPPPMYGPKGSTVPAKFLQAKDEKPIEEPPPPKRQFCEACEMELQSIEDFRRHRAQHERCPVEGCKYKGHPSVMDKHVIELHNSGVFDKIKKLSTPEEIAAWREERRKKFPTLENAKLRQMAEEQKQRRGERIQENKARFGRPEDRKRARTDNKQEENGEDNRATQRKRFRNNEYNNKRGKDRRINERTLKKPQEKETNVVSSKKDDKVKTTNVEENISCGIKMFRGTNKMQGYKHEKPKARTHTHTHALLSLVGMYGSDDNESGSESDDMVHENGIKETEISIDDPNERNSEEINISKEKQKFDELEANSCKTEITNNIQTDKELLENQNIESCDLKPDSFVLSTIDVKETTLNVQESAGTAQENAEEINPSKSSHKSSDEGPEEAPIQRKTNVEHLELEKPTTSAASLNSLQPETVEAKRLRIQQLRKQVQELEKRKSALNFRKKKLRKQNTMLEKLLEPEIRHERNVLLQCVRYVCDNNFFGIGSKSTSNEETKSNT